MDRNSSDETSSVETVTPMNSVNMEMNPAWKICGYVLILILIIMAIVDVLADPSEYTEYVKWIFAGVAILSILLLMFFVIGYKSRTRATGYLNLKNEVIGDASPNSARPLRIILRNMPAHVKLWDCHGNCPSGLFVTTFLIFTLPNCLSIILEIICRTIDMINSCEDEEKYLELIIASQTLLLVFTVLQTQFLLAYFRQSIQIRLKWAWLFLSVIVATNIAVWLFVVQREVTEHEQHEQCSFCGGKSIYSFAEFLFPFQIEYCVMSSLMALAILKNTGRFPQLLRRLHTRGLSAEELRKKVQSHLREESYHESEEGGAPREFDVIVQHPVFLFAGLFFILTSIVVATFVRLGDSPWKSILLHAAELLLNASGLVGVFWLVCYLKRDHRKQISKTHLTDRLLLWCGVAAVLLNCTNTIWNLVIGDTSSTTTLPVKPTSATTESNYSVYVPNIDLGRTRDRIIIASSFINVLQSVLQVFVLEYALICKFTRRNRLFWYLKRNPVVRGVLHDRFLDRTVENQGHEHTYVATETNWKLPMFNFLILLNASEWILCAICFSSFIPHGTERSEAIGVLPYLLMPLQVFYRFHSATCIHDFKDYVEVEGFHSPAAAQVEVVSTIDEPGHSTDGTIQFMINAVGENDFDFQFGEIFNTHGQQDQIRSF